MNHQDVLNRFGEVNVTDLFGTKKEVKELPNVLQENETIMYATSGFVDNNTWLITCTDKRIIFLDKGMIFGLKQVEIPIEKINSVSHSKGLMFGTITIHHGSDNMEIKQISKTTLTPMIEAINNEIEKTKDKNNNLTDSNNVTSIADEISKFKDLLDAGAITEDEYEIKKTELLNS